MTTTTGRWGALAVLATAQFLMVLDQAVMNVSISQLVADFDTTVTTIQAVITLYSLVMAALMVTGGKIGDLVGRRRALAIGLVIYASGSALTAVAWSVPVLGLGWSVLEGIGAALVLPALVALIAGNYEGRDRIVAYAVIGGVAGVGIAVGPILGGWMTTDFTWRLVFVGEVVVSLAILASLRLIDEAPRSGRSPRLDWVGSVLSAIGLGLVVYGVLQASTWGWLVPNVSPVEPLGFSLTPFVVAAGLGVLVLFGWWQRRRERAGLDPLVELDLLRIPPLRAGLQTFLAQNLVLMGVFFGIPLYLQLVVGLDALQTGIRMLPVSIAMFVTSVSGSALAARFSARTIVQGGFSVLVVALVLLLGAIRPALDGVAFGTAMAALGVGLGLIASQLGNVVQSAVGPAERSEAGGLQYTAQQLGSSLGVAFIGAVVLTGLATSFLTQVEQDPRIAEEVAQEVSVRLSGGVDFVASDVVAQAAVDAGLDVDTTEGLVENYAAAQLLALKAGMLAALALSAAALLFTRHLPATPQAPDADGAADDDADVLDATAADTSGAGPRTPPV